MEMPIGLPYVEEDNDEFRRFCLEQAYQREHFKKGEVLSVPGINSCGFLYKGRVKVFIGTDSGNERLMWFLESGNIIPEGSGETFSKRLVADTDCEVLYISNKALFAYALTGEKQMETLLGYYKKRYILCLQSMLQEHEESSRGKVYRFIYELAVEYGQETADGLLLEKMPSRSDIAALLGIHRSNVTRYISDLEKQGVVSKIKKTLLLRDSQGLADLIEQEKREQ